MARPRLFGDARVDDAGAVVLGRLREPPEPTIPAHDGVGSLVLAEVRERDFDDVMRDLFRDQSVLG